MLLCDLTPSIHFFPNHSFCICALVFIVTFSVYNSNYFSPSFCKWRTQNQNEFATFSKHFHTCFCYHSLFFILPSIVSITIPILNKNTSSYPFFLCSDDETTLPPFRLFLLLLHLRYSNESDLSFLIYFPCECRW